jgi:hypothetical protein
MSTSERPDRESRAEFGTGVAFTVSILAAFGLLAVYWRGGQPQLEGTLLALSAGGIAVGLITWSHRLLPNDEEVEDRGMSTTPAERAAFDVDLDRGQVLSRRRLLRRFLVVSSTRARGRRVRAS